MSFALCPACVTHCRYLGSFQGHCGILGRGYLGGDPNTLSKNALKSTSEACFAPCKFTYLYDHGKRSDALQGGCEGASAAEAQGSMRLHVLCWQPVIRPLVRHHFAACMTCRQS
jgi:hypothetical protein